MANDFYTVFYDFWFCALWTKQTFPFCGYNLGTKIDANLESQENKILKIYLRRNMSLPRLYKETTESLCFGIYVYPRFFFFFKKKILGFSYRNFSGFQL
jgi:hypothetical protein